MKKVKNNELLVWHFPNYDEFDKICEKLPIGALLEYEPSSAIYHYTGTHGMKGIIESKRIRFTDAYFMNDSTELEYATKIINKVLDEYFEHHPELRDLLAHFKERMLYSISALGFYLACFSEEKAKLSQWRSYGSYCLEFCTSNDIRVDRHPIMNDKWSPALFRRVEYDKGRQEYFVRLILDSIIEKFIENISYYTKSRNNVINDYGSFFISAVSELIIAFKDPVFEEEREWRIVYISPRRDDKDLQNINFREKNDVIVPYTDIELKAVNDNEFQEYQDNLQADKGHVSSNDYSKFVEDYGKFPLSSISIGPRFRPELDYKSIKLLLKKHKLSNASIGQYNIPLRDGW